MRLRIKEICDYVSRGTTPDYVDEGANKVMNQATFSKGWLDESNIRYTSKANKGARIMKGDLLMASTGGGVLGKVFFFDDDDSFYADSHVTIMRNSKGANLMKYLYYYFYLRYDEINATMVKGSTNQTELQRNYLLSYELDVPTLADQQRMVTYLDTKLSEIDHQVSLLTSKRDAYLRLKKSIINHAVTHGLDPNVKMKDSGIEWIGEVPEHWEVKRMKDICDYISRGSTPDYVDEDYQKVMNQGTFSKGWIDESNIRYTKVGKSGAHIKKGDLLMASTGGGVLGKILYFDSIDENYYADSHVTIMRNSKGINSMKFLFYHFSLRFDEINATMTKGSTNQTELQRYELLSHNVAIPPLPEQRAIATYLDDKCAKIDTIVSNLGKQISRYADLKRSLIDEVITGKRAV
nr:restriction endonuclease subunit S [Prevotella sp.]